MAVIRALEADEWRLWRDLRLSAVAEAPDAFGGTLKGDLARPEAEWVEMVGRTIAHPDGHLLVAEEGDRSVGMTFCRLRDDRVTVGIGAMWVAPDARGAGVGRALLDEAVAWGRRHGARRASLWVTDGNAAAMTLYRSAGFRPSGETAPLREGSALTRVLLETTLD